MTPFDPRLPIIAAEAKVKTCHVFHCWQALRDMGKHFHATAFANFAGLEERHVLAILTALREHDALPGGRTTSTRGTRLALDFKAPDEWVDWAIAKRRWRPEDVQEELERFANHWHAKSGADACKLDWRKTWQNWVIGSRRPTGDYRPHNGTVHSRKEWLASTIALYEKVGRLAEAEEFRRELDGISNVVPFNQPQKMAQNGG